MRKITFFILLAVFSVGVSAQDRRPEERRFRADTTVLRETGSEFILPEFIITGQEELKLEVGEKFEFEERKPPHVDLKNYEILSAEKFVPTFSIEMERDTHLESLSKSSTAKFKAGVGRYLTTYFDGMIQGKVLENLLLRSGFYHRASQGFIENADYTKNRLNLGVISRFLQQENSLLDWLSNAKLLAEVNYQTYGFGFYGSSLPSFRRNISDLSFSTSLESSYRETYDYSFKASHLIFSVIDTITRYESSDFEGRERRTDLNLNFGYRLDFLRLKFSGDYTVSSGRFLKLALVVGNLLEFFEFEENYQLDLGINFFSFSDFIARSKLKLYPKISFRYLIGWGTHLYAFFSPEILNLSISDYIRANRFLTRNLNLVYPDMYVNLGMGVNYGSSFLGIDASVNFRTFKSFPIYVEHDKGFYGIEFEKAQFVDLKISGDVEYRGGKFMIGATLSSSYNAKSKKPVPYYPSFSLNIGYSHAFKFGLAIDSEISLISSRVCNFEGDEIRGFVFGKIDVGYEIFRNFRIFVSLENLFSQRYYVWNNYLEPSFTFLGGVEYKF